MICDDKSRKSYYHICLRLAEYGNDWQTCATRLSERGKHLLDTGVWSDCEFIVGVTPNMRIFHCHKLFLAMASPVFEAMFFGGLAETRREIKIPDVQPEAFSALLSYIYTDKVRTERNNQPSWPRYSLMHL